MREGPAVHEDGGLRVVAEPAGMVGRAGHGESQGDVVSGRHSPRGGRTRRAGNPPAGRPHSPPPGGSHGPACL